MRKKVLFLILFFVAVGYMVVQSANAYTYDGEYDPSTFFSYEPLFVEQLSPITALIVVGKEGATPRYVVVCAMRVQGGLIILAYAYYDADFQLKHFMMNQETKNYDEHPFDHNVPGEVALENKLREILNAFHGITSS